MSEIETNEKKLTDCHSCFNCRQGVKWIRQKYGKELVILRPNQKSYIDEIEKAISMGRTVLLENISETIDAVLNPLLSRQFSKRGTTIKIGDKEVDFNPSFRLILQTKLSNPQYKPEIQAQTTLIQFSVTREGLEQQLLAEVVKAERPDLEHSKQQLTLQQNHFKITLKSLEDELLARLNSVAGDNVLEDPSLVVNLEETKKTAADIEEKVCETRKTTSEIDAAREIYRCVAQRASILYFILNDLCKINLMYQFSLKAFIVVFKRAINETEKQNTTDRVTALLDSITYAVYSWTLRALFEKDKIIYKMHLAFQILIHGNQVSPAELDFVLRFPYTPNLHSPFDFLPSMLWGGVKTLSNIDGFFGLERDIDQSMKRWKKFIESEAPEMEILPGEWKNRTPMQKLCILRTLRPDRMIYAAACFIEDTMGERFRVHSGTIPFAATFHESCKSTPLFFILSQGVDPLHTDVEKLGRSMSISPDNHNFHNISLGQGQERLAEVAIDIAASAGHWVVLQNIHLVSKWLPHLEKIIEETLENVHPDFRLFVSAEESPDFHAIPQGILEASIKITTESPTGIKANLHRALDNFSQEMLVSIKHYPCN